MSGSDDVCLSGAGSWLQTLSPTSSHVPIHCAGAATCTLSAVGLGGDGRTGTTCAEQGQPVLSWHNQLGAFARQHLAVGRSVDDS